MLRTKPPQSPKGNETNGSTKKIKGQASKTKRYRGNKTRTKTQGLELEANTNFKGRFSDLEGYAFDLVPRSSNKFSRIMKEL